MKSLVDEIFRFLHYRPESSRAEISAALAQAPSVATMKRILAEAVACGEIAATGTGRATRYSITPRTHLLRTFDVAEYFKKEIDERVVQTSFNFDLIKKLLPSVDLFSAEEHLRLAQLHERFSRNTARLSPAEFAKETERLGIDLCWKSSQIEGNTYSLLETERLLRERTEAHGHSREEAVMLLNHKSALNFLAQNEDYLRTLSVRGIADIHRLLVEDLNIDRNIRRGRVGITGTNYRPLDNEFQIEDAMREACTLINARKDVFEKALLAVLLISYIQPFADGNKRTARIVGNALLMANRCCPLSYRSVDPLAYKEALLVFYEQNNLFPFKEIFVEQFEFAVKTYF